MKYLCKRKTKPVELDLNFEASATFANEISCFIPFAPLEILIVMIKAQINLNNERNFK